MAAGDLTTLDSVKQWLNVTGTTASDALLTDLIAAASASIQKLATRTFALATYVEARNGMGGRSMAVMNFPIVSVGSVMIDGNLIPARPNLAFYSAGIGGWTNDLYMIYLTGFEFSWGKQNVLLTYDAGYQTTPPDVEQACNTLIGNWFKYRDRMGKASESIEGQSISFTSKMYADGGVMDVINSNKRVAPVY